MLRRIVPAAMAAALGLGLVGAGGAGAVPRSDVLDPDGRPANPPTAVDPGPPAAVAATPDPGTAVVGRSARLRPAALPVLPPPPATVPLARATVTPTVGAPLSTGQVYEVTVSTPPARSR